LKIRVIGYNSEEIKDKRYSILSTLEPANELEEALAHFFSAKKNRSVSKDWSSMSRHVTHIHPLWFERIAALVSKYALVDIMTRANRIITLDIPNLRPSFERILANVIVHEKKRSFSLA
jgi:hypothetical protein